MKNRHHSNATPTQSRLVRRSPRPLALEQRFMFDGAAVADAAATTTASTPDVHADILHVSVGADKATAALNAAVQQAEKIVADYVQNAANRNQLFQIFNGGQNTPSAEWNQNVDTLIAAIHSGTYSLNVELRSSQEMNNALAAFASHGENGQPVIYINADWIQTSAPESQITRALVEEIGHSLDISLNSNGDTPGDEGELFAAQVLGSTLSYSEQLRIQQENDFAILSIGDQQVSAEEAASSFNVANATLDFSVGAGDSKIAGNTNSVGETWLYSNVITVGGQQIDAIVKMVSSTGTISAFDSTSNPYSTSGGTVLSGADKFLQPNFTWGNSGGSAEISVSFILGNSYNASTNPTGTATTLRNVLVNSYDLDSSSGNTGKQYTDFTGIGGYELSSTSALTRTTPSAGVSRFMPPTSPGTNITALPGTTTGDNYRVRVSYDELSTLTVTLGDLTGGTIAYYALDFGVGPTFTNVVNHDLVLTGGPLTTSETGTTASFSLKLSAAPTANVTVTLTGLDTTEGSLSTTTLTFTTANWNTAQTVTVTGVDDVILDGNITYTLTATTSSSDVNFNGQTAVVDVTNQDNEVADTTPPTIAVSASSTTLGLSDTSTITFTLSEASTDFVQGDVTVTGGTLSNWTAVSGTVYTATFTPNAASGTVSVASTKFSDAAGNFNNDGGESNNSVSLTWSNVDSRTISVTGYGPVNEGSQYAMFTVTAIPGNDLDLALQAPSSGTAAAYAGFTTLQYSTDGTTWTTYDATHKPNVPAAGMVYVRVDITSEHDNTYEGAEKFALKASYTTNTAINAAADDTIIDDGTGTKYPGTITGGNPGTDTTSLDDDRTVSVTGYGPVNEGSQYAMFTVTAIPGNDLDLTLQAPSSGTAAAYAGFTTLQYSTDGTTWTTYDATHKPTVPAGGKVYVRVDISSEQDTNYEGAEKFALKASYTTNTAINAAADDTIIDDGTGTKYPGTITTGSPDSSTSTLDDDRSGTITVTGGNYNENSPRAVFTVNATSGQTLDLAVHDSAAPGKAATTGLAGAPLYYSLDGGATWVLYTGPITAGSLPILVAVDITAERDNVFEGEEQLQLIVNAGQPTQASGYSSIFDDNTGTVTDPIDANTHNNTGADNGSTKDDDRPVPPAPTAPPVAPPVAPVPPAPAEPAPVAPPPAPVFDSTLLPPSSPLTAPPSAERPTAPVIQDYVTLRATGQTGYIGDAYTSPTGFRIVVKEAPYSALTLFRGVADQYADTGSRSTFAVPYDAFAHTDPNERITLTAGQSDGSKLPAWVQFDASSGKFTFQAPAGYVGELKIKVTARDSQGGEVSTLFRFNIGQKRSGLDGRSGLSEQLRLATRPAPTARLAQVDLRTTRPVGKAA